MKAKAQSRTREVRIDKIEEVEVPERLKPLMGKFGLVLDQMYLRTAKSRKSKALRVKVRLSHRP